MADHLEPIYTASLLCVLLLVLFVLVVAVVVVVVMMVLRDGMPASLEFSAFC